VADKPSSARARRGLPIEHAAIESIPLETK